MHASVPLTLLAAVAYAFEGCKNYAPLTVHTTGGEIHGLTAIDNPNVRQFLGIPYGKPPVGELRFASPQPAEPFGSIEAKVLPPSCPQVLLTSSPSIYNRDVLEFNLQGLNKTGTTSEDCLTLSVWTPTGNVQPGSLPVFIFIYGGGFLTGGEDVPYQIPTQWVQRTQAHIVVSINYRLNFFGFPSAAGLPPDEQNFGLLDQRLAVEWIAKNIAAFGGDPNRMVLWGQSAGAMSVASYNFAYPENPIVKGLIQDSGTEFIFRSLGSPSLDTSNFTYVAQQVGCGSLSPADELSCVRSVPYKTIEDFLLQYGNSGTQPALSFSPSVDEKLVFSNFTDRILSGGVAKLPLILGTNVGDGFATWNPDVVNQTEIDQSLKSTFLCPAVKSTINRDLANLTTYRYRYEGNFSNISPRSWEGAYHSSELPMIFGTHPNYRGNSTELEYATSHAMQDAWLSFARDGVQGLESLGWPVWDNSTGNGAIRVFGDGDSVHTGAPDTLEKNC